MTLKPPKSQPLTLLKESSVLPAEIEVHPTKQFVTFKLLLLCTFDPPIRSQANQRMPSMSYLEHTGQSRPDSGLGSQTFLFRN